MVGVRNPILRTELKVVDDTRAERLRSPHNSGFQELIGCFRKAMILPLGVCTLTTALHLAASTDSADHDFCCSYVAPLFFCGYVRQRAENSLQRSNLCRTCNVLPADILVLWVLCATFLRHKNSTIARVRNGRIGSTRQSSLCFSMTSSSLDLTRSQHRPD
jgi:hypothetical protein